MSARVRVVLIVTVIAAAAATVAVGAAVLQSSSTTAPKPRVANACAGGAPFLIDLGLRRDPDLVRARALYERARRDSARRTAAERAFTRLPGLQAAVGAALAAPNNLVALTDLARAHPRSSFVQVHLGLALFCAGRRGAARAAWRAAVRVEPDSASAISAEDFLHPQYFPGRPPFTPSFALPGAARRLTPATLRKLARSAAVGGARARLVYGIALQRLQRPVSAERQFELAARAAPDDVDARVAAAVGRFDKDHPARAFARLGPLTRRFPRSASVRFHLGLLLFWLGQRRPGETQLRAAVAAQPASPLAVEAKRLLAGLATSRTGTFAR